MFKKGDRVRYYGNAKVLHGSYLEVIKELVPGKYSVKWIKYPKNTQYSPTISGESEDVLISEEIYNSPLFKLMKEEE